MLYACVSNAPRYGSNRAMKWTDYVADKKADTQREATAQELTPDQARAKSKLLADKILIMAGKIPEDMPSWAKPNKAVN